MGKLDGKVAFITGAARGQGRSHAVTLAAQGADIIAVDICSQLDSVGYPMASTDDLAQTADEVAALGRRCVTSVVDVRDLAALQAAFDEGSAKLGSVGIVLANAGIGPGGFAPDDQVWEEVVGVNLKGVYHTGTVAIPSMIAAGKGGSIVITASLAGLVPYAGSAAYVASKHGVNGLMKVLALDLGEHRIRVNGINPSTVDTPMIQNEPTYRLFAPDREGPISREEFEDIARPLHALPIPYISVDDVSELVLWLASDASRHMTGTAIRLDAGAGIR